MLHLEPLGTGLLLPAIVVGYEVEGVSLDYFDEWVDTPDWLFHVFQQAGGYCMRYPTVVGCLLRLSDNGAFARDDIDFLVRGFGAMAEDPDIRLLRQDYPVLEKLVYTWGEDYDREQLRRLHTYLRRWFELPKFRGGFEAFVVMEDCDPLEYFRDWNVLHAEVRIDLGLCYNGRPAKYVSDWNVGNLDWIAETKFDPMVVTRLHEYGARLKKSRPQMFLLWENSD